jgi:hypothetical protein
MSVSILIAVLLCGSGGLLVVVVGGVADPSQRVHKVGGFSGEHNPILGVVHPDVVCE